MTVHEKISTETLIEVEILTTMLYIIAKKC